MALVALSASKDTMLAGWMWPRGAKDDTAHAWRTMGTREERAAPCRLSCRLNTCTHKVMHI